MLGRKLQKPSKTNNKFERKARTMSEQHRPKGVVQRDQDRKHAFCEVLPGSKLNYVIGDKMSHGVLGFWGFGVLGLGFRV